jgi:hypothetical protein
MNIRLTKVCKACKRNFRASESYIKKHECFCNECHHVPGMREKARVREESLDYDSAMKIWDELGETKEAARVRKLKSDMESTKIEQTVIHGDQISKTEIKDSILNRSNIGSGGDHKLTKIKELKELLDSGAIDDAEFKQMKKEILGK